MHDPSDLSADDPQVLAADELVQRVADGAQPPTGDRLGDFMARWRAEVDAAGHIYDGQQDPATTRLPHPLYSDPRHNPIAFLPVALGRLEYEGHTSYATPVQGAGEDDDRVTATWNGLRPEDAELSQPAQDPEWVPDADR